MPKTILVVDDKASVRTLLREYLTAEGFQVFVAENGQNALYAARQEKPDLVLLDIMMPEMDGYEFVRLFRRESNIPVLLLTAKIEETDKVLGLELGADDYITKPFSMKELVARVRAALRRTVAPAAPGAILRVGEIALDQESHQVTAKGCTVRLTPSEFNLLSAMMTTPGRVFSRLDLMEHLQGMAFEGAARTVDVHIRNLRAKIEPDPTQPHYIETVFGIGYRFARE